MGNTACACKLNTTQHDTLTMHVHTPPACKEIAQKQEFTCRFNIKKTPVEKGKVNRRISGTHDYLRSLKMLPIDFSSQKNKVAKFLGHFDS